LDLHVEELAQPADHDARRCSGVVEVVVERAAEQLPDGLTDNS
jgi:hypothetical protein